MAISPDPSPDQKLREQPPREYCLRLAQEMKAFPRKHRLAEFRAEVVVEQTQVLSAALEDAWSKSFRHSDKPKRVDESDAQEIADRLHAQPRVQARMATLVEYPPTKWLLEQELSARGQWQTDHPSEDVYFLAESLNLKGICFSGGGIRSATFNLGVLQGLAALEKLGSFDYLSTVSGGGYIHQFLASWISQDKVDKVQRLLQPLPSKHAERTLWPEPLRWLRRYSNYLTPQVGLFTADTWVAFAVWLRNTFLNQIVLIASILFVLVLPHWRLDHTGRTAKELILHGWDAAVVIFVCFVLSSIYIRWQIRPPQSTQAGKKLPRGLKQGAVLGLVLFPLVIASFIVSPYLFRSAFWRGNILTASAQANPCLAQFLGTPPSGNPAAPSTRAYIRKLHSLAHPSVLVPSSPGKDCTRSPNTIPADRWFVRTSGINDLRQWWSAYSFHWWSPIMRFNEEPSTSWVFVSLLAGIGLLILAASRALPGDWRALILLVAIPGAMAAAYVFVGLSRMFIFASSFFLPLGEVTRFNIALLPPLALAIIFVSVEIGGGLVGNLVDESVREWFARLRAWSFLFGFAWFGVVGASLLGPRIARDLFNVAYIGKPLVLGWIGTTLISVLAGKSAFTSGTSADKNSSLSRALNILALIGPPIFIVGLALILSYVVEKTLSALETSIGKQSIPHPEFFALLLILAATAAIFGWRIDINEFSLHAFYRDRLARCYAGASDPDRRPNRFTGFAAADKRLRLIDLLPAAFSQAPATLLPYDGAPTPKIPTYQGPFPIFCTTLNLSFGEDLAYQERKGTSFAFTPLYCGYDVGWTDADNNRVQFNGYTPTLNYAYYERWSAHGHRRRSLRSRHQSKLGLSLQPHHGLPADDLQRPPRSLDPQPAPSELSSAPPQRQSLLARLRSLLSPRRALRHGQRRSCLRLPHRRRPLRKHGPVRTRPPPLHDHRHLRRRAGRRSQLRRHRHGHPQMPHRLRRRDQSRHLKARARRRTTRQPLPQRHGNDPIPQRSHRPNPLHQERLHQRPPRRPHQLPQRTPRLPQRHHHKPVVHRIPVRKLSPPRRSQRPHLSRNRVADNQPSIVTSEPTSAVIFLGLVYPVFAGGFGKNRVQNVVFRW